MTDIFFLFLERGFTFKTLQKELLKCLECQVDGNGLSS